MPRSAIFPQDWVGSPPGLVPPKRWMVSVVARPHPSSALLFEREASAASLVVKDVVPEHAPDPVQHWTNEIVPSDWSSRFLMGCHKWSPSGAHTCAHAPLPSLGPVSPLRNWVVPPLQCHYDPPCGQHALPRSESFGITLLCWGRWTVRSGVRRVSGAPLVPLRYSGPSTFGRHPSAAQDRGTFHGGPGQGVLSHRCPYSKAMRGAASPGVLVRRALSRSMYR